MEDWFRDKGRLFNMELTEKTSVEQRNAREDTLLGLTTLTRISSPLIIDYALCVKDEQATEEIKCYRRPITIRLSSRARIDSLQQTCRRELLKTQLTLGECF